MQFEENFILETLVNVHISVGAETAPCANSQKLDIGMDKFFLTETWVFLVHLVQGPFMVKLNHKVFFK